MKDLQEATTNICRLKGELFGIECMLNALLSTLPEQQRGQVLHEFGEELEAMRVALLNDARTGEHVIDGLDAFLQRASARFHGQ